MAHALIRHFVLPHPHVGRMKVRERRLRAIVKSTASEIWLRWELLQIVARVSTAGADLVDALRPMFEHPTAAWDAKGAARTKRGPVPGMTEREYDRFAAKFGGLRKQAEHLATLATEKNLGNVDARLTRAIAASVKVDISPLLVPDHAIAKAMHEAAVEAADLITSIPERYLTRVRAAVERAWTDGGRWEDLAADVEEIGHITERRARFIARDQTAKMNAAFNQVRQTGLGIEEYTWRGVLDSRERPSHRLMEGTRCQWASPPDVEGDRVHPGQAPNCRCSAEPILNLDDLPSDLPRAS